MNSNEADIAWVLALQSVAPLDSKSWREDGFVLRDALSPELIALLSEIDVHFKAVLQEGKWIIPAAEWFAVYHAAFSKLHNRMYVRSLNLSAIGPTQADLKNAPVLSKWLTVRDNGDQNATLVGLVAGHPLLGTRWTRTSRLCGIDPDQNWARTCSRWYVLEEQSSPAEMVKILGDRASGVSGAVLPLHEALSRTYRDQAKEGFRDDA